MRKVAAYIERDIETGFYVGIVPGIPGAHTQGETLDELQRNLKEVLELSLAETEEEIPEFVGIQEIEDGEAPNCHCPDNGEGTVTDRI